MASGAATSATHSPTLTPTHGTANGEQQTACSATVSLLAFILYQTWYVYTINWISRILERYVKKWAWLMTSLKKLPKGANVASDSWSSQPMLPLSAKKLHIYPTWRSCYNFGQIYLTIYVCQWTYILSHLSCSISFSLPTAFQQIIPCFYQMLWI